MRRLAAVLAAGVLFVLLPAPAHADILDCEGAPNIGAPNLGYANDLDRGPADPDTGDPFADESGTTMYEAYGWGGLEWPSLGDGCTDEGDLLPDPDEMLMPDAATDPGGAMAGTVANWFLSATAVEAALLTKINRWVYETDWVSALTPVTELGQDVFGFGLILPAASVMLAGVGATILWQRRKGDLAEATTDATWALVCLTALAGIIGWAHVIAPKATEVLTTSVQYAHDAVNDAIDSPSASLGDAAAASIHEHVLWRTWCTGMVGTADGPVAEEYCPRLWEASTFTRAELAEARAADEDRFSLFGWQPGRSQYEEMREEKLTEFGEVAAELREEYPGSHEYLAGERNTDRIMAAGNGWMALQLSLLFTIWATILVFVAILMITASVFIAPVLLLFGLWRGWGGPVKALLDSVVLAGRNAIVYGALSVVMLAAYGRFLGTGLDPILALLTMTLFTGIVWWKTSRFRKVRQWKKRQWLPPDGSKPGKHAASESQPGYFERLAGFMSDAKHVAGDQWGAAAPQQGPAEARPQSSRRVGSALVVAGAAASGGAAVAVKAAGKQAAGKAVATTVASRFERPAGADASMRSRKRRTDAPPAPVHVEPRTDGATGETVYPIFTPSDDAGAKL